MISRAVGNRIVNNSGPGTMAARPVLGHVILMSIIFEHYKQLRKIGTSTAIPQILE